MTIIGDIINSIKQYERMTDMSSVMACNDSIKWSHSNDSVLILVILMTIMTTEVVFSKEEKECERNEENKLIIEMMTKYWKS